MEGALQSLNKAQYYKYWECSRLEIMPELLMLVLGWGYGEYLTTYFVAISVDAKVIAQYELWMSLKREQLPMRKS